METKVVFSWGVKVRRMVACMRYVWKHARRDKAAFLLTSQNEGGKTKIEVVAFAIDHGDALVLLARLLKHHLETVGEDVPMRLKDWAGREYLQYYAGLERKNGEAGQ